MNLVNVCLSCDDNYSKYASVVIASILDNLSEKSFANFYILDGNITKENKKASRKKFWKKRPLCFLHPKYLYAFYCSYIKK